MEAELAQQVLTNGLQIENIPLDLRTESVCINALKWGLNTQDFPFESHKDRITLCARIMKCFPEDILIIGFVTGHLSKFGSCYK